jgi:lipoprotein-anchoring transpeptidase ErfK/SrfK
MILRRAAYRALCWAVKQQTYKVVLAAGCVFLFALLALLLPILLTADASAFGRFPIGARVGTVYVGELTREEAVATCNGRLAGFAAQPLVLKADYDNIPIDPSDISLQLDYRKLVDQAYKKAWDVNILERMARTLLNEPKAMKIPPVGDYDEGKLKAAVKSAMDTINCTRRDAYIDVSTGGVKLVPGRDGRMARYDQVLGATRRTLANGMRVVEVPVIKRTPAKVKKLEPKGVIVVNLEEHTLSLFMGEQMIARYPVATGSKKYPTVIGEWKVVRGEKNPTWYNRGAAWSENMPWMMPPGPRNPLGTRAITINGGGVMIHGTNDTGSIGYSASHGCVRMYMQHVENLFEYVYLGMPVFIIQRSGDPGFDCSKKAYWKYEEERSRQ